MLKDILKPFHPTETVVLQFLLDAAREPPNLKLAHPCDSCGKAFAYREALISHKKKKHNTLVPQVFQCKYCDYKGAKTLKAHRAHERRHARPAVKNAPQHQCESCEKRFFGEKQLEVHVGRWHREHVCRVACGSKFPNKAEERRHFFNKHKRQDGDEGFEVPPPCPICGKSYNWKQGLKKHLRTSQCGEILKEQQKDEDREEDAENVDGGEKDKDEAAGEKEDDEERPANFGEVVENEAGREKDKDVAAGEKEVDEERPATFGEVVENEAGGEKDKDVAAGEKEVVEKEAGPSEEGKKRGKKRKAPGGSSLPECKYEQIRKRNIKEKEDFLASLDSE